jgi:signal transduction histidine kinase
MKDNRRLLVQLGPDLFRLKAYIADLELEVDRLRRHSQHVVQEARTALDRVRSLCNGPAATGETGPDVVEIAAAVERFSGVLLDMRDPPGYHPANDQVVAVAVRPLVEQVFRWQQRLQAVPEATLHLELESEHVEWFPARLRHILDNLISNALKYRDPAKVEAWVRLRLRTTEDGYELSVSDNGLGLAPSGEQQAFDLFYRAAPARAAGLGVGLPVVKLLVEQSGGAVTVTSDEGQGTTFVAVLPRFDVADYLV